MGLFALGEELGAVEIYWPVLQILCFVNVGMKGFFTARTAELA